MLIQVASDLHLEFYRDKPRNKEFFAKLVDPTDRADLLILAGDIGYPEDAITNDFIHWCCSIWPEVVWIYGNHEYYNKTESHHWKYGKKTYTMLQKDALAPKLDNLHGNNEVFLYDGIPILGVTLWTDVKESEAHDLVNGMADFKYIKQNNGTPFTLSEWTSRHIVERKWLQETLDAIAVSGRRAIVVTHHLPTYKMILPQYETSKNNCGFAAHADDLVMHPAVILWVCGHSHGNKILSLEDRYVILNARGYQNEDSVSSYNPKLIVDLPPSLCGVSAEALVESLGGQVE